MSVWLSIWALVFHGFFGQFFPFPGPSSGGGTPVFAKISNCGGGGPNSATCAAAINTTGANFIVASVSAGVSVIPTFADLKSNTWHVLNTNTQGSLTNIVFYCSPCMVGTSHNFTETDSGGFGSFCVIAFSGAAASPFDLQGTNVGNNVTSSITPSVPGALVFSGFIPLNISVSSVASPFVITDNIPFTGGNNFGSACAFVIQTVAIAAQATWMPTGVAANSIASFKP